MPMTNAERQKRYREKLKNNPEKHEKIKEQTRERMKKRKPISEVSEDDKKKRRKQWQMANEKRRKKKAEKSIINEANIADGASSSSRSIAEKIIKNTKDKKVVDLEKKVIRQKNMIENMTKENKNLKKQVYRQKIKIKEITDSVRNDSNDTIEETSDMTPLTKTNKFIEENIPKVNEKEKEKVKRKVLQLNVLSNSLQEEYNTAKTNTKKEFLKRITSNKVVRKYKLKTSLSQCLGLKGQVRQKKEVKRDSKESDKIKKFFKRDDNSRNTAGKKEYVLDGKIKKQKRFLLNSLRKLHEKYKAEGGKLSLSSFCRYRPRYIIRPKITDRDTCACIKHCNITFKAQKLKKLDLILTTDLEELVSSVACSTTAYECMYSKCPKCKDKSPEFNNNNNNSESENTCSWLHWVRKEHEYNRRTKDGTVKSGKTKKYVKEIACGTILDLKQLFLKELFDFRKHYFNIIRQHTQYRECVENLNDDEICILIDFSENYQCKLSVEIQSFHFGASQQQITLHTGVLYAKAKKPMSFASISACNDHDPGAIRAHLEPVIQYIKQEHPNTKVLHFFSDGPTTQYRQKKNFYLINQLIMEYGFTYGTWSFSEAAHGKGAADGVGGTLKRTLDQQVAFGKDVSNLNEALEVLKQNTKITLFHVTEAEIRLRQNEIPDNLIAVPKTMNVHQVIFRNGDLYFRDVSCFCGLLRGLCACFNIQKQNVQIICTSTEHMDYASSNNIAIASTSVSLPKTKNKATKKLKKKNTHKKRQESMSSTTSENSDDVPYAESDDSLYSLENEKFDSETSIETSHFQCKATRVEACDIDNESWCQTQEHPKRIKIESDILLNYDLSKTTGSEHSNYVEKLLMKKKLIRISEQAKISSLDKIMIRSEKPDRNGSPKKSQEMILPKSDLKLIPKPDTADQIQIDSNNEQTKMISDKLNIKPNELAPPDSNTKTLSNLQKSIIKTSPKDTNDNIGTSQFQRKATRVEACDRDIEEMLGSEKQGFEENSWVLCRYKEKYYYVAQIMRKSEFGSYKILSLTKINENKFCLMDFNEQDDVLETHIVCSLMEPECDKSGQYIFNNLQKLNYL